MSDEKERKIFSKNLNYFMDRDGKSQSDIINDLGVNKSTISTWCNGIKMPRMSTIQMLADYFNIRKSDLVEEKNEDFPSSDTISSTQVSVTLTPHEQAVLTAYRAQPEMQPAVDRILGVVQEIPIHKEKRSLA